MDRALYRSKTTTEDPAHKDLYLKLFPLPNDDEPSMLVVCSCPTMADFRRQKSTIFDRVLPSRSYSIEYMDRRCRRKSRDVVRRSYPDGLRYTFHERFDVIWFCGCNTFLPHGEALDRTLSALKPNGVVLFTEAHTRGAYRKLRHNATKFGVFRASAYLTMFSERFRATSAQIQQFGGFFVWDPNGYYTKV